MAQNTPQLWKRHALTCRDVEDALELAGNGTRLTGRQWAALLWAWTDIQTCAVGTSVDSSRLYVPTETLPPGGWNKHLAWMRSSPLMPGASSREDVPQWQKVVAYHSVGTLADKAGPWHKAADGQMRDWVNLLADEQERQLAWNYAHGQYIGDAPGLPSTAAVIRERIEQGRQLNLAAMVSESVPSAPPLVLVRSPEEQERVEFLRRQAADVLARQGQGDPVAAFMGEGE
jgi:hypothetical protein